MKICIGLCGVLLYCLLLQLRLSDARRNTGHNGQRGRQNAGKNINVTPISKNMAISSTSRPKSHVASTTRQQKPRQEIRYAGMSREDYEWVRNALQKFRTNSSRHHGFLLHSRLMSADNQNTSLPNPSLPSAAADIGIDDILLTKKQVLYLLQTPGRRLKRKVASASFAAKWTMPVNYAINSDFTAAQEAVIDRAVATWARDTCITFRKRRPSEIINEEHLRFNANSGCGSYVGKSSKTEVYPQMVYLHPNCLYQLGTPIHEIGHALGLFHEQSRPDRDTHVDVLRHNIESQYLSNFDLMDDSKAQTHNIPYDYGSVMHYPSQGFLVSSLSPKSEHTLVPKDKTHLSTIGQRTELSFYDAKIINLEYCKDVCPKLLLCQKGGYTDPKDCTKCRCPNGWGGKLCNEVAAGSPECTPKSGIIDVASSNGIKCIQSPSQFIPDLSCAWHLKAPANHKISLWFNGTKFGLLQSSACYHWVEIQYLKNHAIRGQRFCGSHKPPYTAQSPIISQTNEVMVLFNLPALGGLNANNNYYGFQLCFKTSKAVESACASSPCLNGGSCSENESEGGYTCSCQKGYAGKNCETVSQISCPPEGGFLPDPEDCGSFYQCSWNTAYHLVCPTGLHFNPRLNICDYPRNVNCVATVTGQNTGVSSSGNTEKAFTCPSGARSDDIFADPSNCGNFYQCVGDIAYRTSCPAGLKFSVTSKRCDYPHNVQCTI